MSVYLGSTKYNALLIGGNGMFHGEIVAGETPVLCNFSHFKAPRGEVVAPTGITLTIPRDGTYRMKTFVRNPYTSSSSFGNVAAVQFYKNSNPVGETQIAESSLSILSADIICQQGDVIEVYASSVNSTYMTSVSGLMACIDWDNGFQGG